MGFSGFLSARYHSFCASLIPPVLETLDIERPYEAHGVILQVEYLKNAAIIYIFYS